MYGAHFKRLSGNKSRESARRGFGSFLISKDCLSIHQISPACNRKDRTISHWLTRSQISPACYREGDYIEKKRHPLSRGYRFCIHSAGRLYFCFLRFQKPAVSGLPVSFFCQTDS